MELADIVEAWRVNHALNLELLDACPDEALELKPGKGKTIRSNFVHIVGVRRMWLEDRMRKEAATIPKLDWKTATRDEIRSALEMSLEPMNGLFAKMNDTAKPGRMGLVKFFAYALAHEAHHRSQIEISLRLGGHEPDDAFLYGLWEWSKK